jgi:hypothetical protein
VSAPPGAPTSFRLAPMTRDVGVLTGVALAVPAALLGVEAAGGARGLERVAVILAAVYASVWLVWRPTRFELDAESLRIVWPLRMRTIPRRLIRGVRIVTAAELCERYGRGMRIGAGGLWGGFGLYKTRTTTFSFWISRTDRIVLVELDRARPLLVTPDDPDRFAAMLSR